MDAANPAYHAHLLKMVDIMLEKVPASAGICIDGTASEDCVPTCTIGLHGVLLLLNIDGEDSKLSCELHHAVYSWVGAATDGGYLGSDLDSFFSAVVSSAAGFYAVMLVQNAGITTLLTVRPGQSVAVTGDPSLPEPPDW